jgi:hypothetical protein
MSDSDNTFKSLLPIMKDTYASKMQKISEKPNSSKRYFALIKKKLKEQNKK